MVIFNDAIVDECNFAGLVEMRMGVGVGRWAMRCPTSVADADVAVCRLFFENGGEIVNAAGFFPEFKLAGVTATSGG